MSEPIILTGSTGWVGKNFLHELQKRIPPKEFNNKVFAFGSKSGQVKSTAYIKSEEIVIPIYPLSSIKKMFKNIPYLNVIHTAFLRKEKIKDLGLKNYIETNRYITNQVRNILASSTDSKLIDISSGAASILENKAAKYQNIETDPYGFLKLEEEKILSSESKSIVMRIYALSGKFITNPNLFALGNFLLTAIRNEKICLYSNTNIIRSYGYAGEIAASGLGLLYLNKFSKKKSILDCASHTINLLELAKKISKLYKLPLVDSNIDFSLEENKYTCDIKAFRTLLVELNIEPITLEKQIEITYNYIKKMS